MKELSHAELGYSRRRNAFGRGIDACCTIWARRFRSYQPRVILLHRIVPSMRIETWGPMYTRDAFANFLDYLQENGFSVWRLDRLAAEVAAGRLTRDHRVVGICFDDGTEDVYTDAWPLLNERGMEATVFVTTTLIGARRPPVPWEHLPLHSPGMTEDQLRELDANGMEIASHAVHHYRLPELNDVALAQELSESRVRLEQILGHSVKNLSYPHGAYDQRIMAAARSAGYSCAWSCQRVALTSAPDMFALPRCDLPADAINRSQFDSVMWDGELARRMRDVARAITTSFRSAFRPTSPVAYSHTKLGK